MNRQQVLNLLGMAYKSRRLVSGQDLVLQAIKQQQAQFVFLASDLSVASKKELKFAVEKHDLPFTDEFSQLELSQAIGRPRKTIAITDQGFSNRFEELTSMN
ncbi:MAG: ribosomal L7Ae/L30e/S12e/Gadd45 family protein [Lactobacillus sp.]|nr:ribosomal L7Ae/L30e/S12e/Gadd45 family protein [Lactobacillus sp.]